MVTGGGLSATGHWVVVSNGFLLPLAMVMALFRGKLLAAIRREMICAPRSVRGPSNPALKRTAAGSEVPLSIGPAAA